MRARGLITPEQFLLVFTSEAGALYDLRRNVNLSEADWSRFGQVTGLSGHTAVVIDRSVGAQAEFFSVRDVLPDE